MWSIVTLEEIAAKNRYPIGDGDHGAIKPSQYLTSGVPYIRVADIDWDGNISLENMVYISKELNQANPKSHLFPGDIVIAKTGATIGKAAIIPNSMKIANTTSSVGKITLDTLKADAKFVLFFIQTKEFQQQMWSVSNKSAQPGFNIVNLKKFLIPCPPLKDQIYIANVLSKTQELIAKRKESIRLLDEFLKSTFLEMFGDPVRNEKKWNRVELKSIAKVRIGPFGSLLHRGDYVQKGVPLVNPSHIGEGKIFIDPELTISKTKMKELTAYVMREGDVVLGRRGEIGRCAVVTSKEDGYLCGTGSIFIRPTMELNPIFLYNLISSTSMRRVLENLAKGVTMKNLNSRIIENLKIPLPKIETQILFAKIVDKTTFLKTKYEQSLLELENLYDSLSQKAFSGKLKLRVEMKEASPRLDHKEVDYFKKRKALACYIIKQSLDDDKFGDTKFEKLLNLSDEYAIKRNLGQQYYQKVAGPYDNTFTKLFYLQIEKGKLFQRKRSAGQSKFIPGVNHDRSPDVKDYFSKEELARVDKLINLFKKSDYQEPEIISTLYAVWNNRIIRQQFVSDDVLKSDFLAWDARKVKYKNRLDAALTWMRKESIIPDGWGKVIEKPKSKKSSGKNKL